MLAASSPTRLSTSSTARFDPCIERDRTVDHMNDGTRRFPCRSPPAAAHPPLLRLACHASCSLPLAPLPSPLLAARPGSCGVRLSSCVKQKGWRCHVHARRKPSCERFKTMRRAAWLWHFALPVCAHVGCHSPPCVVCAVAHKACHNLRPALASAARRAPTGAKHVLHCDADSHSSPAHHPLAACRPSLRRRWMPTLPAARRRMGRSPPCRSGWRR